MIILLGYLVIFCGIVFHPILTVSWHNLLHYIMYEANTNNVLVNQHDAFPQQRNLSLVYFLFLLGSTFSFSGCLPLLACCPILIVSWHNLLHYIICESKPLFCSGNHSWFIPFICRSFGSMLWLHLRLNSCILPSWAGVILSKKKFNLKS